MLKINFGLFGQLFLAKVDLSDFSGWRLWSCVQPFDAIDVAADLDEIHTLDTNQITEFMSRYITGVVLLFRTVLGLG